MIHRIQQILASAGAPGSFATRHTAGIAKDWRAHVHGMITSYELPVTHVTRRTGSPFTRVLTKTRSLFTRDATERATWTRDLAWLRESATTRRRMRVQRK